jgi:hypothetical protein
VPFKIIRHLRAFLDHQRRGGGKRGGGKRGGAAAVSTRTALLRTARPAGIVRKVDSEVVRAAAAGFEPLGPILAGVAAGVMRDGGRGAVGGGTGRGGSGSGQRRARCARGAGDRGLGAER